MSDQRKNAEDLLAVAARMRGFARETTDAFYRTRLRKGAGELEMEAIGYAAAEAVARALREARARLRVTAPC